MSATAESEPVTVDERQAVLARAVEQDCRSGWRAVSQTGTQAQLVKGKPTNHVLHLILTLLTLGLWSVVWLLTVIFAGEKQRFLSVDEQGRVHRR